MKKNSEQERVRQFLHKTCNLEVSCCSRAKQRQRNVQKKCAARVKFLFLLIITTVVFPPASNADFLKGSSRVPALITEPVRMCFACQHFDVNSAGWISDNLLHVISS